MNKRMLQIKNLALVPKDRLLPPRQEKSRLGSILRR